MEKTNLSVQIDAKLSEKLDECVKKEKRTKRAVVELALEEYFKSSPALNKKGGAK